MIVWIILGTLLALLLILFLTPCRLIIEYSEELIVRLRIWMIDFKLLPAKEQKYRLKDYKKLLRAEKKEKNKAAAAAKRSARPKKKKPVREKSADTEAEPPKKLDIGDIIRLVTELVKIFIKRFGRHLRIEVSRLDIIIGTEDAAKTAITYGLAIQSASYLFGLLDKVTNLKAGRSTSFHIEPDFSSEHTTADIYISFRLVVWQAVDILLRVAAGFIKMKLKKT